MSGWRGVRVQRDIAADRDEGEAPGRAISVDPFDQLWSKTDGDEFDRAPAGTGGKIVAELVDEQKDARQGENDGQGDSGAGDLGHGNLCRRPSFGFRTLRGRRRIQLQKVPGGASWLPPLAPLAQGAVS